MAIEQTEVTEVFKEHVHEVLADSLLTESPSGPKSILRLAREYGVSSSEIREALILMERDGDIIIVSGGGFSLPESDLTYLEVIPKVQLSPLYRELSRLKTIEENVRLRVSSELYGRRR